MGLGMRITTGCELAVVILRGFCPLPDCELEEQRVACESLEIRKAQRPNFTACIVDASTYENEYRVSCLIHKRIREVPFHVINAENLKCTHALSSASGLRMMTFTNTEGQCQN